MTHQAQLILAGDIGGTKTSLALYSRTSQLEHPLQEAVYRNDEHDDFLGVIFERESKLLELLSKPKTMEEIVEARIVYKKPREPKLFYEFGERALMKKHIERLMVNGKIKEDRGRYQIV